MNGKRYSYFAPVPREDGELLIREVVPYILSELSSKNFGCAGGELAIVKNECRAEEDLGGEGIRKNIFMHSLKSIFISGAFTLSFKFSLGPTSSRSSCSFVRVQLLLPLELG